MTKLGDMRLLLLAGGACFALGACETYLPYDTDGGRAMKEVLTKSDAPARIDAAMNYAIGSAKLMVDRANSSSGLQTALYAAIIPTTAMAAYYGITGDRGEGAITSLTTIAATAYGVSTLTQATPREMIYIAGAKAITCVIWNSAPLAIPAGEYAAFKSNIDLLRTNHINLTSQTSALILHIAELERQKDEWSEEAGPPDVTAVDAILAEARRTLENAKGVQTEAATALDGATKLNAVLDAAAVQILAHTKSIESAVNAQLATRQPSPEAVMKVAGDFKASTQNLIAALGPEVEEEKSGGGPEGASGDPDRTTPSATAQHVRDAVDRMRSAIAEIDKTINAGNSRAAAVTSVVAARTKALEAAQNIKLCEVAGVDMPFSISPPVDKAEIKPGGEPYGVTMSGGSGTYDARIVGHEEGKVHLIYPGGSTVASRTPTVKVDEGAKAGSFILYLNDFSGEAAIKKVTFTIKDGAAGGGGGGGETPETPEAPLDGNGDPPTKGPEGASGSASLSQEQVALIQLASLQAQPSMIASAGGFVDGDWGPKTQLAARHYMATVLDRKPADNADDLQNQLLVLSRNTPTLDRILAAAKRTLEAQADRGRSLLARDDLAGCDKDALRACWAR